MRRRFNKHYKKYSKRGQFRRRKSSGRSIQKYGSSRGGIRL